MFCCLLLFTWLKRKRKVSQRLWSVDHNWHVSLEWKSYNTTVTGDVRLLFVGGKGKEGEERKTSLSFLPFIEDPRKMEKRNGRLASHDRFTCWSSNSHHTIIIILTILHILPPLSSIHLYLLSEWLFFAVSLPWEKTSQCLILCMYDMFHAFMKGTDVCVDLN